MLASLLLSLGASSGLAATTQETVWQPYACGLDADCAFVSYHGVSLSVSEQGLQVDPGVDAGAYATITPATNVSSLNFSVLGYTNLHITLTGDKGVAKAVVNNGSLHSFVPWKLTAKNFAGNAGKVSTIKIRFSNNPNFGSAPCYMRNLQVNGHYANAVLKSAGCL